MPTSESFDAFVQGLTGRAKERAFTLQIRGSSGSNSDDSKRLLRASYNPGAANQPGGSYAEAQENRVTTFELDQAEIERLRLPAPVSPVQHLRGRVYVEGDDPHRVWHAGPNQRFARVLTQDDVRNQLNIGNREIIDVEEDEQEQLEENLPALPPAHRAWTHRMVPPDRHPPIHREPPPPLAPFFERGHRRGNFGVMDLVGPAIDVEEDEQAEPQPEFPGLRPLQRGWMHRLPPNDIFAPINRQPSPIPAPFLQRGHRPNFGFEDMVGPAIERFQSPPPVLPPPAHRNDRFGAYQFGQVDFGQGMTRALAQDDDVSEGFGSEEEEDILEDEEDLRERPPHHYRWYNFMVPEEEPTDEHRQPSPAPAQSLPRGHTPVNFRYVDLAGAAIERFQSPAPVVSPAHDDGDVARYYQFGQVDWRPRMARAMVHHDSPEEFESEEDEETLEEEEDVDRPARRYQFMVPEDEELLEHRQQTSVPPLAQPMFSGPDAFAAQQPPPRWFPGGLDPVAAYYRSIGDMDPRTTLFGARSIAMDVDPAAGGLE